MTRATRRQVLEEAGLLHPRPEAVTAPLFDGREPFFLPLDKVQVKYEMLRAHLVEGVAVVDAASQHGYSRAAFYLVAEVFNEHGMLGLELIVDRRRAQRPSGAELFVGEPDAEAPGRPRLTSSSSALRVSSISVAGSGRWYQYTSITSVPSRRSEPSTASRT